MLTRTQLADIYDALNAAHDRISDEADVIDGPYGEPAPNLAMSICAALDEAMVIVEREFEAALFVEPFPSCAVGS